MVEEQAKLSEQALLAETEVAQSMYAEEYAKAEELTTRLRQQDAAPVDMFPADRWSLAQLGTEQANIEDKRLNLPSKLTIGNHRLRQCVCS